MPRRLTQVLIVASVACLALLAALGVMMRLRARPSEAHVRVTAPLAIGTALPRSRAVPHLSLIDARGRRTSLAAWHGRYLVLAPSMTLCQEVCPLTTGALIQLTDQIRRAGLARRVVVVEATVDPWRDTPARLRAYRRLAGVNFQMLTGSPAEIRRLWRFFGVFYHRVPEGRPAAIDWMTHRPETFDIAHTDALFFIDPDGRERIADAGMADVQGRLSPALRRLLSSQGRHNLSHPQLPWTAARALQDVDHLMGRSVSAGSVPGGAAPTPATAKASLAGSPRPLAAIHAQAGQLLGSDGALRTRLASWRGRYPVVLNAWASWCPGCRGEFPLLAAASARFGRRVAFVGVDTNDSAGNARRFLAGHYVSYPSYQAGSAQLSPLAVIEGLPTTIFISRSGRVSHIQLAPYQTQSSLDDAIEHFALGASG